MRKKIIVGDRVLWSNNNIVYACHYHVVWCPKYRRKVLEGKVADRLKEIICGVCNELGAEVEAVEVMPDHVHLLVSVDPHLGIHRLVKRIKGRSSRILRQEFPHLRSRLPTPLDQQLLRGHDRWSTTGGYQAICGRPEREISCETV